MGPGSLSAVFYFTIHEDRAGPPTRLSTGCVGMCNVLPCLPTLQSLAYRKRLQSQSARRERLHVWRRRGKIMRMSRAFALLILLAATSVSAATVDEAVVQEIGSGLRCVVCQNLSVADSPSEMANQMRGVIRERLAAGDTPEQVVHYFVGKYGEWILLAPAPHGFNLVVWVAPVFAVLIGLGVVALLLRRWTRPRAARAAGPVDPAIRERIRREIGAEP